MIVGVLSLASRIFDGTEAWWERARTQRRLAVGLVVSFLLALAAIELRRRGWLPGPLRSFVGDSHFQALHLAFTLLLLVEVVGLVLALARSVANAAGKQFEILSLILLRKSFEELTHLGEPLSWREASQTIGSIVSDAVGALLIFVTLGFYYRLQRHRPITADHHEQDSFVATKKLVALVLLGSLVLIGAHTSITWLAEGRTYSFFEALYTVLIFADVLIVLVSLRYSTAYPIVFRYFGFAAATVLVRLALTAPRVLDAALGLGATVFATALTWAYNRSIGVFARDSRAPAALEAEPPPVPVAAASDGRPSAAPPSAPA